MRTSKFRLLIVVAAVAALVSSPSALWALTDEFDDDPRDDPDWELFEPVLGSEITVDNGVFRFTFPVGIALDHWTGVNNAVQLRRTDLFDDFYIETRVLFVGSDDPAAPIWPPYVEAYQAGLMIAFGANDLFYFGPYTGTQLRLERSGQNGLCSVDPGLQEVTLRIEKLGSTYLFRWRADDADPWSTLCQQTVTNTPISVGLVFKSWGAGPTVRETFDFDYFTLEEKQDEAPSFVVPCELGSPDRAWLGMPYVVPLEVEGFPVPSVMVLQGPESLTFDASTKLLGGWTPGSPGTVALELEAENPVDSATYGWDVDVASSSILYDDPFEDDPVDFPEYWELAALQGGIVYSLVDEDDNTWWRMEVPMVGDLGASFDTWTTVNNAPQLRHPVDPGEDFVIETRVRIPAGTAPVATNPYLAGLMLDFNGAGDIIHWNIGGERLVNGVGPYNVFMERSGANNLIDAYVNDVITGRPVDLRIQRRCDLYTFFYRGDGDRDWTFAGLYKTLDEPLYVGLVMKTWGGGTAWTVDFDYFDFVEPGPNALFTLTPQSGPEPLEISVDASASSSPNGNIVEYLWDFGDGSTSEVATATHSYVARGNYEVTLTVRDSQDDQGYSFQPVTVEFRSDDVSPWTSEDVSASPPMVAGGARFEGECLRMLAGGTDIDGTSDGFHFVYQSLQGNGSLVARLSEVVWSANAKAGVMIRESVDAGSPHASLVCQNRGLSSGYSFVTRATSGGPSTRKTAGSLVIPNAWVKIERVGNELIGSYSSDGAAWNEASRATLNLPETVLIGLATTARDTSGQGTEIEALFCDVTLTKGGGPTEPIFHRGDANGDGQMNITDGIFVLNYLFLGGETPGCIEAANGNDDGEINITDGIFVLNYLFLGGPTPPAPGPVEDPCGPDPVDSPSNLGCESYPNC